MNATHEHILDDLTARGLVADVTAVAELRRALEEPTRLYCGFDPTADSLHVGSLLGLAVLRLFAHYGHQSIALIGGATGMIGDPSGKSAERNLLDEATLDRNRTALDSQIRRLLTVGGIEPIMVDNRDWFGAMSAIDFLRDIGKLAPVGEMLSRSSARTRLASESGLSFTEFSYQLLQAHDFVHLRRSLACELQVGGTDQFGNIAAGIDMVRRNGLGTAYGLVWPLMVKADGTKFGKTEQGNVWLDAARTRPYTFHQFWLNTPDDDARDLLAKFTLRPLAEIDELMARHAEVPGKRLAQRALADDVTTWVHGAETCARVVAAGAALFSGDLDENDVELLKDELEVVWMTSEEIVETPVEHLVARTGLARSVSEARRALKAGGVYVDGRRSSGGAMPHGERCWTLLARGRKRHALIRIADSRDVATDPGGAA
jgi:tyrosyl-tRNA synthetase